MLISKGSSIQTSDIKDTEAEMTNDGAASAALEWSQSLILSVLHSARQGVLIANSTGHIEFCNKSYVEMFGHEIDVNAEPITYLDHVMNLWESRVFYGGDVNSMSAEDFRALTTQMIEQSRTAPQTVKLVAGKYISFEFRQIENDRRVFTFSDVTLTKMREQEFHRARVQSEDSLADLNTAINNTDVGLVLLDKDMKILIVNEAFNTIWGSAFENFPKDEHFRILMDFNRLNGIYDVEDKNWEAYVQSRISEIRRGDIKPREFARADGKILIYSCTALSDGQRLVRYSDITEYKRREAELEQAQLAAARADKSKSEFLANMSHEIRTPMNGVMGMAELLGNTDLDAKQKMFTEVILNSSAALLTIINDILDFSKIEAGKLELEVEPFCLSAAVEDIATLVATNVAEKELELIVRIQPGLIDNVIGDVGRFRQILTNLMGNAVKFTQAGHVLVDISGAMKGDMVELKCTVQDTGMGIPQDQIETIFEKFSQVDGSSTRRHEGTGLGLAISSRLIDLMGGEIGCESILGEGSTFWFSASLPVDTNVQRPSVVPADVAGARILAIDDNSVNRSILLEQLDYWNIEGEAASSGLEGVAMLRQSIRHGQPFDAVVLDFHMPDMNGIEVARIIRNDDLLKDSVIIMLTSVDNISDRTEFKALNINAHLTKPARASQLLESIGDVLRMRQAPRSVPSISKVPPVEQSVAHEDAPAVVPAQRASTKSRLIITKVAKSAKTNRPPEKIASEPEKTNNPPAIQILVAEDNEVNQMVFRQVLEYLGYEYKIVKNGALAVAEVKASHPQIVLMDVAMPVVSGLDATREIRKAFDVALGSDGYRPVIIGITAHALKADEGNCLAAGMDDYMPKPISPKKLGEKISHWLSQIGAVQKTG